MLIQLLLCLALCYRIAFYVEERKIMTSWIDFRQQKPKEMITAIVFNEKGFMSGQCVIALYYPNYDVWYLYDPNYRESLTLEVTHYLPIPTPPILI